MGKYFAAKYIGMFHEDSLVAVMGYKKEKAGINVSRFASKINTKTFRALGLMLKKVEEMTTPEYIVYEIDLRYGNGEGIQKLGFVHKSTTLGWKWTDGINTFNRLRCRANMDDRKLSEKEHAAELGWYKIYDAGQAKFVKKMK